mmetsp:Transcript_10794/g.40357  ORF Transcript_10794/g.40357 Transcript_10794/m.40357 type:complete len:631 (-) Transcript_10794:81-1973(-)
MNQKSTPLPLTSGSPPPPLQTCKSTSSLHSSQTHHQQTCFPSEIWFQIFLYLPIGFLIERDEKKCATEGHGGEQEHEHDGGVILSMSHHCKHRRENVDPAESNELAAIKDCGMMMRCALCRTESTLLNSSSSSSSTLSQTRANLAPLHPLQPLPSHHIYHSLLPLNLTCHQFNAILSQRLFWEEAYRAVFFAEGDEFLYRRSSVRKGNETPKDESNATLPHAADEKSSVEKSQSGKNVLSSMPLNMIRHKFLTQVKSLCGEYVNCGKAHHLDMYQYYIILGEERRMDDREARLIEAKIQEVLSDVRRDLYGEKSQEEGSDTLNLQLQNGTVTPIQQNPTTSSKSNHCMHINWPSSFTFGIKFLSGKTFRLDEDIRSILSGIQFGRFVAFTQRWITSQHFVTSTIATTDEVTDSQFPDKVHELRGSWHDVYQFRGTFSMLRKTVEDPVTNQIDDDDNPYTIHWIQQFSEDSKKRHPLVVMETSKWCTLDAYMLLPSMQLRDQDSTSRHTSDSFNHLKFTLKLRNTFHKEIKACYVGGSAYQILEDGSQASECVIVGNIRENFLSFIIFHGPETELKMRVLCRIVRTENGRIQECVGVAHDDERICGVVRLCVDPKRNVEKFRLSSFRSTFF